MIQRYRRDARRFSLLFVVPIGLCFVFSSVIAQGAVVFRDSFEDRFAIGGSVVGLAAGNSLELLLDVEDDQQLLQIAADGPFEFPIAVEIGLDYEVSIVAPPLDQTCGLSAAAGTVNGPIPDVGVTCAAEGQLIWDQGIWNGDDWN